MLCVYEALLTLSANCVPVGEPIYYILLPLMRMLHLQNTGSKIKLKILRWWQQRLKTSTRPFWVTVVPCLRLALTPDPWPLLWEGPFLMQITGPSKDVRFDGNKMLCGKARGNRWLVWLLCKLPVHSFPGLCAWGYNYMRLSSIRRPPQCCFAAETRNL